MPEHGGADIESALVPLRRSLEADHFGFVAHVLTVRDACTSQNCKTLALLRDPSRVRSNLSAQALDRYLDHYQEVWAKAADGAPAEVAQAQPNAPGPHKLVNIDFPSAASIPPVSIINPEPTGPVLPGVAAAAAANPNSQAAAPASRRSRKQAANPPAPSGCSTCSNGLGCDRADLAGAGSAATSADGRGARRRAGSAQSAFTQRQRGRGRCGRNELSVNHCGSRPVLGDVQLSPHCQPRRNRLPYRAHRQTARHAHDRGLFGGGCPCPASPALRRGLLHRSRASRARAISRSIA